MRKPRKLKHGASYLILASAQRQEDIIGTDRLKNLFLSVMRRAKRKYRFTFQNFCLLENRIHFILEPSEAANLSKIMQWILSVYAIKYNKLFGFKGHVWYDRFKSRILSGFFQYVNAHIYLACKTPAAGLVHNPMKYPFCGLYFLLKGKSELFVPV